MCTLVPSSTHDTRNGGLLLARNIELCLIAHLVYTISSQLYGSLQELGINVYLRLNVSENWINMLWLPLAVM